MIGYISKRKSNRLVSREIYEQKFYEENDLTETKEKSWNEIAKTYEITLNNESNTNIFENKFIEIGWPENLYFPTEGFLPQNQFIELLDILKKFTHNQVIIYQQIPHNNWKNKNIIKTDERYKLFRDLKTFNNNKKINETGFNDFWEGAKNHPDLLLEDLHDLMHRKKNLIWYQELK